MRLILALVTLLLAVDSFAVEGTPLSPDAVAAFEWFSTVGFPSPKGLEPIRIRYGRGNDIVPIEPFSIYGYLVGEKGQEFTFLTTGLHSVTRLFYQYPQQVTGAFYEKRTWDQLAAHFLDPATKQDEIKELSIMAMPHSSLPEMEGPKPDAPAHFFMLAWCCWQNQRDDLAKPLLDRALAMVPRKPTVREAMLSPISTHKFELVRWAFYNQAKSRAQLIDEVQDFVNRFPGTKAAVHGTQLIVGLRSLQAEEKNVPKLDRASLLALPSAERARVLVLQLRDERGNDHFGPSDDPSSQLERMGPEAVPALLDAVDDFRPAASAYYSIGDQAANILSQITNCNGGHPVEKRVDTIFSPSPAKPSRVKRAYQKWWAEYRAKGERQHLIDAVSEGGIYAGMIAFHLREKYPDDVTPAVKRAFPKATDHTRIDLIQTMNTVDLRGWGDFLSEQVRHASSLEVRAAAATSLRRLGDLSADELMLEAWSRQRAKPSERDADILVEYLAASGDVSVLQKLTEDFHHLPLRQQRHIMNVLAFSYEQNFQLPDPTPPPEVKAFIELLLVSTLDDARAVDDSSLSQNIPGCTVGDLAADHLNGILRQKYAFDISAPAEMRALARRVLANQWQQPSVSTP